MGWGIGVMIPELLFNVEVAELSEFSWKGVFVEFENAVVEFEAFCEDLLQLLVHGC